ncbi:MAG: nucleoside triphosphate pyrophosphohydrolase family protein [Candidatus Bathyanammoxibius sp.]
MGFDEYQSKARLTAVYPDIDNNLTYPVLGLAGEAGEVANKVKKIYRDRGGVISESDRATLCSELGDVLWYVAAIASELQLPLGEVVSQNLEKLWKRQQAGTLHGAGDKR